MPNVAKDITPFVRDDLMMRLSVICANRKTNAIGKKSRDAGAPVTTSQTFSTTAAAHNTHATASTTGTYCGDRVLPRRRAMMTNAITAAAITKGPYISRLALIYLCTYQLEESEQRQPARPLKVLRLPRQQSSTMLPLKAQCLQRCQQTRANLRCTFLCSPVPHHHRDSAA